MRRNKTKPAIRLSMGVVRLKGQLSWDCHIGFGAVTRQKGAVMSIARAEVGREFALPGVGQVSVEVHHADGGAITLTATLTNGSDSIVDEFLAPVTTLHLGDAVCDPELVLAMPAGCGRSIRPCLIGELETIRLNYPVHASMQWLDVSNGISGLYLGCHDPAPMVKAIEVSRHGGSLVLCFRFTDLELEPGESFATPPIVLSPHGGGWREGARVYRAWALTSMSFARAPQWIADAPAWTWKGMKGHLSPMPDAIFGDLPAAARVAHASGVPVLQVAAWFENGHDTGYPDFEPGDCLGGRRGLSDAVAAIHAMGMRVSLYTNGRLGDPTYSRALGAKDGWGTMCVSGGTPEKLAQMQARHAPFVVPSGTRSWDEDGTIAKESYGDSEFAVMCPGSTEWEELLTARLVTLLDDFDIDGIYLDQVCGCAAYACYSKAHTHLKPNLAWAAYSQFLRRLRAAVKAARPSAFLATEGVVDALGQHFDILQGHNDWVCGLPPFSEPLDELFVETFPEALVLGGHIGPDDWCHLRLAHALGLGFDLAPMDQTMSEAFRSSTKWALGLRRLYGGGLRLSATSQTRSYRCSAFYAGGCVYLLGSFVSDEPLGTGYGTPVTVSLELPPHAMAAGAVLHHDPVGGPAEPLPVLTMDERPGCVHAFVTYQSRGLDLLTLGEASTPF